MGKTINGKVQIYAESDVVTVKGTVTGVTYGDYILIESDFIKEKIFRINIIKHILIIKFLNPL